MTELWTASKPAAMGKQGIIQMSKLTKSSLAAKLASDRFRRVTCVIEYRPVFGPPFLVRRLGKFAELRSLWPVVSSHAMARTHMISNQHTSPIALAKSTAIGRKAMTYRNGFMRIGTAASEALSTSTISPITGTYGRASLRLRLLHHRRSLRLPLRNEP